MPNNTTTITGIEQGRAKFAYECANQLLTLQSTLLSESTTIINKAYESRFTEEEREYNVFQEFKKSPKKQHETYVNNHKNSSEKKQETLEDRIMAFYEKYANEYKGNVKKLPAMIKTNGIGETFAFIKSKAKPEKAYTLIYTQFMEWLKQEPNKLIREELWKENKDELVNVIISLNSPEYRAVTIEMFAFLNWLKRFAEGLIEGESDE